MLGLLSLIKNNLAARFFKPLLDLLPGTRTRRSCPQLSDADWLLCGISRVIEDQPSGRAFLQKFAATTEACPSRGLFFESLKSKRRLGLCVELNTALLRASAKTLPDPFSAYPGLKGFALQAGDGHFTAAACHDPRDTNGTKWATGHVYMLNLRTHLMRHLDTADTIRKKEHELRLLKRCDFAALRGGAPAGVKVITVYDRAAIDFAWWRKAKDSYGLYFISRPKENMNLMRCGYHPVDSADSVNAGVISDEQVAPVTHGRMIRRITWQNPENGEHWQFLTNELTLPPGLIVFLYLKRWDIEKVFDEFKTKLEERKSWASSREAKVMQAQFQCLAHNLMVLEEDRLRREHSIENEAEKKRRAKRQLKAEETAAAAGRKISAPQKTIQRCTQRSVKFIRWLRLFLFRDAPWSHMLASLRGLYATP